MQKQENLFFKGHQSTFCIKMPFGIGHPHLHINCSLHVCRRVQGSQIFKRNSIISIRSKVMAFLVISLSPWSPCCPCHPNVIPTSSPCHPRHPHIVPIAPRRSPCGPHGCGLCSLRGLHPMLFLWSPRRPHGLHIVLVIPTSSRMSPHHVQPPRYPLNPPPSPLRSGGPRIIKSAIRFELIKIF